MHSRAFLLVAAFAASSAFTLPRPATFARKFEVARRAADDAADGVDDDAAAAPSLDAVETAVLNDALDTAAKQTAPRKKKKKRPVDPERAATKFVKTATNPVTWKNGIYAGSLAIAVLLPVALLALAQK